VVDPLRATHPETMAEVRVVTDWLQRSQSRLIVGEAEPEIGLAVTAVVAAPALVVPMLLLAVTNAVMYLPASATVET
jgi:hypothetical protein